MIRILLLLLLCSPSVAQQLTGTWEGVFSREGKSAKMQLEILEGRQETVGIFSLYSSDSSALVSRYFVVLVDSNDKKFVLRKTRFTSEKSPTQDIPKQILLVNSNRRGSSPYDPSLTKSVYQQEILITGSGKSMNFEQFTGRQDNTEVPRIIGNWYVTEEGINSHARPTGQFSVQKTSSVLTEESKKILNQFSK